MSRRMQKREIRRKFNQYLNHCKSADDKLGALFVFKNNADISLENGEISLFAYRNICDIIAELNLRVRSTL